jgi:transposase InsO family protein
MAFTYEERQYQPVGCPFGLEFISHLFQRVVKSILAGLTNVKVFLDNIIIHTQVGLSLVVTPEQKANRSEAFARHARLIEVVVTKLTEANILVNAKKVYLAKRSLTMLGRTVSGEGIAPDPAKVKEIRNWPKPLTGDAMKAFIGVCTFLRPHIRHAADLFVNLNALTKCKHQQIQWTPELEENFEIVKEAIVKSPVLRYPDPNLPFSLAVDASDVGVGGVLFQPRVLNEPVTPDNIVCVFSRTLDKHEKKYVVYKKELLAIIHCLRKSHSYVYGRHFVVYTDHHALVFLWKSSNTEQNRTTTSWLHQLLEYSFEIIHIPGTKNVMPDFLSRLYSAGKHWGVSTEAGSATLVVTRSKSKKKPRNSSSRTAQLSAPSSLGGCEREYEGKEQSGIPQSDNFEVLKDDNKTSCDTKSKLSHVINEASISIEDSTRPYLNRLSEKLAVMGKMMPESREKQIELINLAHERGHFGRTAIISQIMASGWWWPTIHQDVARHLTDCHKCLSYNVQKRGYHVARAAHSCYPMDHLQLDFKTGLDADPDGYTVLLVVVDVFTGFVWLRPLKQRTAVETAKALIGIFQDFGAPKIIQGDSDPAFTSDLMTELFKSLGIEARLTAPYTPEKHGKVEITIQKVTNVIFKMIMGIGSTWVEVLPRAQSYYNTMITETTKSTHFTLMFARPAMTGLPESVSAFDENEWKDDLTAWETRLQRVFNHIYPAVADRQAIVQENWISKLNKKRRVLSEDEFPIGALVYYENPNKRRHQDERFLGPWKVIHRLPSGDYLLMDFLGTVFKRPVPAQHLKLQYRTPPAHTDDQGESFEMQRIVSHRGPPYEFLIHWKGYDGDEDKTWVPHSQIHGMDMLREYWHSVHGGEKSPPKPKRTKRQRK